MSIKMNIINLLACVAGGAALGGGAVHISEIPGRGETHHIKPIKTKPHVASYRKIHRVCKVVDPHNVPICMPPQQLVIATTPYYKLVQSQTIDIKNSGSSPETTSNSMAVPAIGRFLGGSSVIIPSTSTGGSISTSGSSSSSTSSSTTSSTSGGTSSSGTSGTTSTSSGNASTSNGSSSTGGVTVPEPSMLVLFGFACMGLFFRRRNWTT